MIKSNITIPEIIGRWFLNCVALTLFSLALAEWVALEDFADDYFDMGRFFILVASVSAIIVLKDVWLTIRRSRLR